VPANQLNTDRHSFQACSKRQHKRGRTGEIPRHRSAKHVPSAEPSATDFQLSLTMRERRYRTTWRKDGVELTECRKRLATKPFDLPEAVQIRR
jgi:hypothetical protein